MDTFCKIAQHRLPAHIVYENRSLMAILDIEPDSPGHTLIITRRHFGSVTDLPPALRHSLIDLAAKVADVLRATYHFDAIIFHHVSGRRLQDVPHCHLHVYGKKLGGGKPFHTTFTSQSHKEAALARIASQLRRGLK